MSKLDIDFGKALKVEAPVYNKGTIPYMLRNPYYPDGALMWVCDKDADGNITSVFCATDTKGKLDPTKRAVAYVSLEEANNTYTTLLREGWQELNINVSVTSAAGK